MITIPQNKAWKQNNKGDNLDTLHITNGVDLTGNVGRLRAGVRMLNTTNSLSVTTLGLPIGFKRTFNGVIYTAAGSRVHTAPNQYSPFTVDSTASVTIPTFTGTGNSFMGASGGTYTGQNFTYTVTIAATGTPDTFNWSDGTSTGSSVGITGSPQLLSNGVYITFAQTTGHTVGDKWVFYLTSSPGTLDPTISDIEIFSGRVYVTTKTQDVYYYVPSTSTWNTFNLYAFGTSYIDGYTHPMCAYTNQANPRIYFAVNGNQIDSTDTTNTIQRAGSNFALNVGDGGLIITFMKASSNKIWIGTLSTKNDIGYVYEWDGAAQFATSRYALNSQGALSCVIKDDIPWIVDTNGVLLAFNGSGFEEVDRFPIDFKYLLNTQSQINNRWIHPNGMTIAPNGRVNILVNNQVGDNVGSIMTKFPSGVWEYDQMNGLHNKNKISYTPVSTTQVNDYGQSRIAGAGALSYIRVTDNSALNNGVLIAGANYYTDASTIQSGVFIDDTNDTVQKYGYIISPVLDSSNFKDNFDNFYFKIKPLLNTTDKITFKYRIGSLSEYEMVINWTSGKTFTTTDANILKYAVGDEIEITQGTGGSKSGHITSIGTTSPYTVSLDDTFSGVSGSAKARVSKWIKKGDFTTQNLSSDQFSISDISAMLQFKLCFQFTGKNEINQLVITNKSNQEYSK